MATDKPLVNKVAQSGLITFKLEEHLPEVEFAQFDIKEYLFMELILKEADFRAALKDHDWSQITMSQRSFSSQNRTEKNANPFIGCATHVHMPSIKVGLQKLTIDFHQNT